MAPKSKVGDTPEGHSTLGGGGSASEEKLLEVFQRITTIETSMSFITAAVDDSKSKIDALSKDVNEAKAQFAALKPVVSSVAKGIWAVFFAFLGSLLAVGGTLFTMWWKHHSGW